MRLAHSPRIWFLAALAALVASFGWNVFRAEEDPNDQYVYDRTESVIHLSLDAPGGTSLSPNDPAAAIGVLLERYSWKIWRQPSTGLEEYRDPLTEPESGATVTLTRSAEMGMLADSTLITDSAGRAWTTFSPDGATSNVMIDASSGDSTASLSFIITSTPGFEESWYLSHTEATLVAEITSALSTQNVAPGENRDLSLSVRYETWDVMASNLGNTRTENRTSAPAEGASVTWSTESGDGTVSGYGTTDSGGLAQGSFTMGSGESIIRAEIGYATGQATTATLTYSPPIPTGGSVGSAWTQIGSETIPTIVNLSADGSTELATGETRQISGQVQGEVWDIWTDGTEEDRRYNYTTSLSWMPLFADVPVGDGSIGSPNLTTDGSGWFSTSYTMGTGPAQIALRFDPLGNPAATVDFTLASSSGGDPGTGSGGTGDWVYLHTDGHYSIHDLSVDGPTYDLTPGDVRTINGTLVWEQWQVWGNSSGSTEPRFGNASAAAWTSVNASISMGDGILSSTGLTTGSLGEFSTIFTMGAANSTAVLSVEGPQGTTHHVGFTRPAAPEQWNWVRDESSIVVALAADDGGVAHEPGQTVPLKATVTATTWEIRASDRTGEFREFNHQTGPAIAATVDFTQISGPGSLTTWQSETDANGVAEGLFVLGENATTIRATATFQTANSEAEIVVSPDLWVYQSSQEELELALSLHGDPASPTAIGATLQVRRSETWRNLATAWTETRHQSLSPAENGQITFTAVDGTSVSFGANPSFTDVSGNVLTEYRSSGSFPLSATASFAGMTVTSTLMAPQGQGLVGTGTDGDGTTDGGGNDGAGDQGNGTDTSGGGSDGGGTDATDSHSTSLRGRSHYTNNPEHTSGGGSDEPELVKMFRATFSRQRSDENGEMMPPEEEKETGREESWISTRNKYQNDPEGAWEVTDGPHFYEEPLQNLVGGGDSTTYGDFSVWGKADPAHETDFTELANIKSATQLLELAENRDHVDPKSVNDAIRSSFENNAWDHTVRETAIENPVASPEDFTASASFLEGIAPMVTSTEVWLESEDPVPADRPRPKRSFILMAKRTASIAMPPVKWYAVVTFEISNGSDSPSRMVSTTAPTVTWLSTGDAPPTSWVVAGANGVLRLQPEVARNFRHEISFLPVEVRDIKDHANTGDDVTIANWDPAQNIADNNIAWIEAHSSASNSAPRMPQLELRMPSLGQGVTIEAKLEVKYERGNGARHPSRTDKNGNTDTVRIPKDNTFKKLTGNTWQIWNEYPLQTEGFFGGDATLIYCLMNGQNQVMAPQTVRFRIGGKNPDPARARAYVETLPNAGPEGSLWFAYAVAKAESKDYNGNGSRYNQFWQLPVGANDTSYRQSRITHAGRPLWGNDGGITPGGYGMFQVTGTSADPTDDIPRQQIWNWQENTVAALAIILSKHQASQQQMAARRQDCSNERGQAVDVPDHSVPRGEGDPGTLFGDPTDGTAPNSRHTFTDAGVVGAVAIKRYNGAAVIAPGSTTGTGDYCVWRNQTAITQGHWEFRRWRVRDGQIDQVSYVDLVAGEIE